MFTVIVKNLWAHKRRLVGMLAAVVLGVGFLAGALALGDTLSTNFTQLFTTATAGTDVVVRAATSVGTGIDAARPLIPESLVATIAAVPGVADAQPSITGSGQIIGAGGKAIGGIGPPRMAGNWVADAALNPYRIVSGRAPAAADEVVVNRGAAISGHLHLGQQVTVETPDAVQLRIVGIARFGNADGLGTATYAGFSLSGAERYLTGRPGFVSSVLIRAEPGVSQGVLAARIANVLPSGPPALQALTGAVVTRQNITDLTSSFLATLRAVLIAFAGIALLVAGFSIANTFSILMAQRTREAALIRTLGATRRQLLTGVLTETLALGLGASVLGLGAGVAIAGGLKGVFDAAGFALPAGGLVVSATTVTVSLAAGTVLTVAAGLIPALSAARVPPLAALGQAATEAPAPSPVRTGVGAAATVAGLALLFAGRHGTGAGLRLVGLGAVLCTVGTVALGPAVAKAVTGLLGSGLRATRGLAGALARDNAGRNPRRTAAAATALMVGVAVVSLFTVYAASLKRAETIGVTDAFRGDLAVTGGGFGPASGISPGLASALAALPGIGTVSGLGSGQALIAGVAQPVSIVDPSTVGAVLNLQPAAGSVSNLAGTELAVSKTAASTHHWRLGSRVAVTLPDGTAQVFTVAAVYSSAALVGDYVLPVSAWAPHSLQYLDAEIFVKLPPGSNPAAELAATRQAAAGYGRPAVDDRAAFLASAGSALNIALGIVYVLLALAVIIAVLGIANTLSLAVHERTREIGLLRAIGQTRSQLRSMIRLESVIVSLFGATGGIVLGVVLGAALAEASGNASGLAALAIPAGQLAVILALGATAGMLAAIRPARRAARMPLLSALAQD
ncbi:MAG TPA: FtsX-like permease family protein [Actinomycetota bacterium]|nr:FtsX-like permease family protein [Actinomycetota bacterium]